MARSNEERTVVWVPHNLVVEQLDLLLDVPKDVLGLLQLLHGNLRRVEHFSNLLATKTLKQCETLTI